MVVIVVMFALVCCPLLIALCWLFVDVCCLMVVVCVFVDCWLFGVYGSLFDV